MVKKSKKVLAMVLALTMITSVFAGTGAFATQPTGTNAPYKASIETNFYTKDANGVRTKIDNNNEVAKVTYYKAGTTEEVQADNLVVGDAYTVKIVQPVIEGQYHIEEQANLLVDLDGTTGEKYLDSTNVKLVKSKSEETVGIVEYTGTFEAMTNSTLQEYGKMELAIDVKDITKKEYQILENVVNDDNNEKGATFNPEKDTFTVGDMDDVYFKLETEKGIGEDGNSYQYSVTETPTLVVYNDKGNDITEDVFTGVYKPTATADFKDGVNRYKLKSSDLKTALAESRDIASFSLTANPVKHTEGKFAYIYSADWKEKGSVSALPGEVVTLTYTGEGQDGEVPAGFVAETTDEIPTSILDVEQYQCAVNDDKANKVSFVMPDVDFRIRKTVFKDAPESVQLYNIETAKAKVVLTEGDGDGVTITEGKTKAIEVAPADNSQKFINYLNTDLSLESNGCIFKYTGMNVKGNFEFDVSITNDFTQVSIAFPSDKLEGNLISTDASAIIVPVCYDQKVEKDGNANVKIESIGVNGKLWTEEKNSTNDNAVKIIYSADKVALYKATLGPDKEFNIDIDKEVSGKAIATINYADVKLDILNLISLNTDESVVNVDINNPSAGEVQLYDKDQKLLDHNVAKLGEKVNVVINVKEGCKFVAASAYNDKQTDTLTLTDESKEEETNIKRFSFEMPERKSKEDIIDVKIVVELKKSINLVNETPEDQTDTNHGYIKGIDGAVMTGETVTFQALPKAGSKYMPSEVNVNAFKNGEEKNTPINVERDMPGSVLWGYKFTVPTDLDADEIKVSAKFEEGVLIENGTPEIDKDKNNGYIDGLEGSTLVGSTVVFQALPIDNSKYMPDEIKVKAYKGDQETDTLFDVKPYEPGSVFYGYQFTVPEGLNADVIKVSATFKEINPVAENGWKQLEDGNWTYMKDGQRVTGWQDNISGWEGQWFYFDPSTGVMVTDWQNNIPGWEGQWFYFDRVTGVMVTDWQNNIPGWEGQWFYFDRVTGVMATGWKTNIPGWGNTWFYFDKNTGVMYKNGYTPDGYYVDGNGCWIA